MFDNVLYRKQAFLDCQNIDFLKVTKDKKRKFVNFYFFLFVQNRSREIV